MDPFAVEVGNGEVATVVFAVGDALGDALVRPGRVVMRLVLGQDGAEVALIEDQHAVEDLSAQGTDKALADRVHARRLNSGAQDPGAGGLEDGVKDDVKFDPRSRIRNLLSSNRSSRLRARLRACCTAQSPAGCAVTPPRCIRRVPCSINTRTCSLLSSTVSTCRKSTATIPAAWACRNCR